MIHGERHQRAPCYARTTRFCRRSSPRPPPCLALARLCISVIRPAGSYPSSLSRCRENMAYYLRRRYIRTYMLAHTHARARTYITMHGESLYGLSSGVVALATAPSFALSPLLFLIGLCSLPPLSSPLGAGHNVLPSRRLGTFRFLPRGGTPRSTCGGA